MIRLAEKARRPHASTSLVKVLVTDKQASNHTKKKGTATTPPPTTTPPPQQQQQQQQQQHKVLNSAVYGFGRL